MEDGSKNQIQLNIVITLGQTIMDCPDQKGINSLIFDQKNL